MSNLFNNPKLSEAYNEYRLSAPPLIVDTIISYLSEKVKGPFKNALDVGCGTGQSTRILSPYFESVIGVDASHTQLYEARRYPDSPSNVRYLKGLAESLPFDKESMYLVSVSSSFHWFEQIKFLDAARTMLRDDGVMAIYILDHPYICGKTPQQTKKIKQIIRTNQKEMFWKFWDARLRDAVEALWADEPKYLDLSSLGFKDQRREIISTEIDGVSLNSIVRFETTMPEYYKLEEMEGREVANNCIEKLKKGILEELGLTGEIDGETTFKVEIICTLIMARK